MDVSLVISFLFLTSLACKGSHASNCTVFPKDVYIEKGSSVEIVCLTSCTWEEVHWKQDDRPPDQGHESKRINSSHTVLTLRNFTEPKAALVCHRVKTDIVIGGSIIRTYTKPSKLSCMLHYKEPATQAMPNLFTCKWEDLMYNQTLPGKITYSVLCTSSSSYTPPYELCKSNATSCTADYNSVNGKMPFMGSHNITVRAKTDNWEVFSDPHQFDMKKILKIATPTLRALTARPGHVMVEWGIRYRVSTDPYSCQVRYRKAIGEGNAEWLLQNKTLKERWVKEQMAVVGMESCSNYTLAVRCAGSGALWSSWSQEKTVLTLLNENDYKPGLWRTLAGTEKDRVRKVRAIWTEAPAACPDTLTYTVQQSPYQEQGTHAGIVCENSICKVDNGAHTISLTVRRNETVFVSESTYVPAVGEKSLPEVTHIQTATQNGNILVSWRAPPRPVGGYMIDCTHNGDQFTYMETKHTSVTLSGLDDKTPYDITVTPLVEDKTGLGARALQVCSRRGAPGAVNISSDEAEARRVLLRWTVEQREVCSGPVVTFLVVYHSENDKSPLNFTVDGKHQEVPLKNLTPGTSYSVFVEARALNGSTRSKDLTFSTKRYDQQLINVFTACGSILIILVLVVGLCCVCQWKKFKDKAVPDPAHSSVATWLSASDKEGLHPVQPFHHPSEIIPDKLDPEDAFKATVPLPGTGGYENLTSDPTKEWAVLTDVPAPTHHNRCQVNSEETNETSLSEESKDLLSSVGGVPTPYRTQSPVVTPPAKTAKSLRLVPMKQRERTSTQTVYVTLDMFDQGC